jgi:hypothetical protein
MEWLFVLAATVSQPRSEVRYTQRTLVEFSNLEITGEVVRPSMTLIQGRRSARFRSLIRYRGDFRPELLRSIDAVE